MIGNCIMCLVHHKRANTPLQCTKCLGWYPESYFAENKRHLGSTSNRVCVYCAEERKCKICFHSKAEANDIVCLGQAGRGMGGGSTTNLCTWPSHDILSYKNG